MEVNTIEELLNLDVTEFIPSTKLITLLGEPDWKAWITDRTQHLMWSIRIGKRSCIVSCFQTDGEHRNWYNNK
jgi:hypothetical protein